MALRANQIKIGGFYVKESMRLVREIQPEDAEGRVFWRSFYLEDRMPTGDNNNQCSPYAVAQEEPSTIDTSIH
jgi:hypothetical protein